MSEGRRHVRGHERNGQLRLWVSSFTAKDEICGDVGSMEGSNFNGIIELK